MSRRSLKVLRVLTPLSALASLIAQGVALLTNEWLFSEELMNNPDYVKFNMTTELEFQSKFTVSGLWTICANEPGNLSMYCKNIDYFSGEEYAPDPNDSTGALPYAAKRACLFMVISTAILISGALLHIAGHLYSLRRVFTFISGIAFILSGLMILAGMVIYISTFKAEVGNKLRPKSSFQGPLFMYDYGMSFYFAVGALMLCELAGTLSIFMYMQIHLAEWKDEWERQQYMVDYPLQPTAGPSGLQPTVPGLTISPPSFDLPPPPIFCRKHGRGRRFSRSRTDYMPSRETSPIPMMGFGDGPLPEHLKMSPRNSLHVPTSDSDEPESVQPVSAPGRRPRLSESMRDLTYFTFPEESADDDQGHFSRDTTCHTMSTSADIYSREISRDSFRSSFRQVDDREELPPPPPPPIALCARPGSLRDVYDYDYEDDPSPPRREFSYETLRRTTPV